MKIHYFQRYHDKENVATANSMLLLSRLYQYSSDKFYRLLKELFNNNDEFDPEPSFELQVRSEDKKSIPDAVISQDSFKIVVETKLSDWFYKDQLIRHLGNFKEEKYKLLLSLAPEPMDEKKKEDFDHALSEHNKTLNRPIVHKNMTFEDLIHAVQDVLDDRDFDMQEILEDFRDYCLNDDLIIKSDAWKFMRVQLAGATIDFNMANNVYYDSVNRPFRAHDYLGLYTNKSVRAIGKITALITAVEENGTLVIDKPELGELTEERKQQIIASIQDGDTHGYDLHTNKHRYFFVEQFYDTDYKKITPYAPMGSRIFDLTKVLGTENLPSAEEIAETLKTKTWE